MYISDSLFSLFQETRSSFLSISLSIGLLNVYFRTLQAHIHTYKQTYIFTFKNQIKESLSRRSKLNDHIVSLSTFFSIHNQTTTIVFFCSTNIKLFIITKVFLFILLLSLRKKKERRSIEKRKVPLSFLPHFLSLHFRLLLTTGRPCLDLPH